MVQSPLSMLDIVRVFEPYGFGVIGDCENVCTFVTISTASLIEEFGLVRLKPNGLSVISNRNVVVSLEELRHAAIIISKWAVWEKANYFGEIRNGSIEIPFGQ